MVRWQSSSVTVSALTADGLLLLEKDSEPALCSALKVGVSGVSQEKYCTVTSYAPERIALPAVEKLMALSSGGVKSSLLFQICSAVPSSFTAAICG